MSAPDALTAIIDATVAAEGGYVNDPRDAGGETNFGVTVAVARANGFTGAMKDMTRDQAAAIYRSRYLVKPGFDGVATVSPAIAAELFDTGVNMGPAIATQFLQIALNALNRQGVDFADVAVNGECDPATRRALAAYLARRGKEGERVLLAALNCQQGARYLGLTTSRPANEAFLYGWLKNRVSLPAA